MPATVTAKMDWGVRPEMVTVLPMEAVAAIRTGLVDVRGFFALTVRPIATVLWTTDVRSRSFDKRARCGWTRTASKWICEA
jgi:hypothetical protein